MQARLTTKPEHEVIAAIQSIDLEPIKLRMMDAELGEGWSREYADGIEAEYKLFLTMLVRHPADMEDILISSDVDEFWHNHILHTQKYADDCQRVFGNFLHHNPQTVARSSADVQRRRESAEKTRQLYQKGGEDPHNAAYCNAAAHGGKSAYCNAMVHQAAYCNAAAGPDEAYCNATVDATKRAYCNATVTQAAYCNAGVEASNAYCNATVDATKRAYCNATVEIVAYSYCNATAQAGQAYCNATVGSGESAYCNATIQTDKAAYCNATAGNSATA